MEEFCCPSCKEKLIPIFDNYYRCPNYGGQGLGHRKYWKVEDVPDSPPIAIDPDKIKGDKWFIDACRWGLVRAKSPERRKIIQEKLEIALSQNVPHHE